MLNAVQHSLSQRKCLSVRHCCIVSKSFCNFIAHPYSGKKYKIKAMYQSKLLWKLDKNPKQLQNYIITCINVFLYICNKISV